MAADQDRHELVVSPSAAARLDVAREWLAALPRDADLLMLAPHGYAADLLLQAEVADSGTRFGPRRFTIDRLAAHLAATELARTGRVAATSLSLGAIAARVLHRLAKRDALRHFGAIGARPRFPHAMVRTFEELRGAGVATADLSAAPDSGPDLAAIMAEIEQELDALGLADRAAFLRAATALVKRHGTPPAGLPLLCLDISPRARLERELVDALIVRSPLVLVTAPEGDPEVEPFEAALGVSARRPDRASSRALDRMQRYLFEPARPESGELDESVSLTSWPGEARECVEIARRIRREAARGTPFDRMAVFLRAPGAYRAQLEDALRRAGIPAFFARGTTRPDPAGRALLALLACAAEGLSARRFAEYLSLAQVPDRVDGEGAPERAWVPPAHELMPDLDGPEPRPPDADGAAHEGTVRAPWRWERLLVDAAVIGGFDRWRRRLDGLIQEIALRRRELAGDEARESALARIADDLDELREFALPVVERLAALPAEASWEEWLAHLRVLAGAAIRHPEGVLSVVAELAPLGPVGPVDLAMVQQVLTPRLRDLVLLPGRRPRGAVFIAPVEMARGLDVDVVFVPGLAERLFPQRIIEDPLLPDEARRAIPGAELDTRQTRIARERLSLRIAIGAARRHAALSWPRIDLENARPRVPSFYGLEAMRAAEGRLPGFDELRRRAEAGARARLGWPAPDDPREAIDDTEYDLAVLARLKEEDPAASAGAAHYLLSANDHLARALRARARRWLKGWTFSDGLVDPDSDTLAALARHRMGSRSFSPTALEHFASCPYRFFLQAVHRLQPREDAEALETIDPLTRGSIFHEVQFQLLTALREGGHLPLDPARLDTAFDRLDGVMAAVAGRYEEQLAPAIPRVWADGVNAIKADLREWLRRSVEADDGWVPHRFELSFGLRDRERPVADRESVPDPVAVLDGGLLLRGSIDLVERRAGGTLRVTDHKTGKARVPEGAIVWGGQALQPVLYALAAEALLDAPVESGRLYYCTADGAFTERPVALDETSRSHARTAIGVIARALETGFLPAAPAKDACRWCDYRPVCGPHEEIRAARKRPDRLRDLVQLRSLP